jgi:hypothetical protein
VRYTSNLEYAFYIRVDGCGKSKPRSWTLAQKTGDAPTLQFYSLKLLDGVKDDFVVRVADEEVTEYFIYSPADNYGRFLWVAMAGGDEAVRRAGHRDQLLVSRITHADCGPGKRFALKLNSNVLAAIDASACRSR